MKDAEFPEVDILAPLTHDNFVSSLQRYNIGLKTCLSAINEIV